jgi:hypothetical protein
MPKLLSLVKPEAYYYRFCSNKESENTLHRKTAAAFLLGVAQLL